ncbi:probable carbohydrate esterase At4g34215 [Lycium barbarum]|uniref:probable carbohydrate esterase At4g34215 n=1 Tax=Lycium barbarum TaxID=112863 RepID=UPI00293F6D27|nr:probable carbohydrate esterase At4g34215 [Lycium barbarum]
MAGRGGVVDKVWDGYVPPECYRNPTILRLNGNSIWEVAQEPIHEDIDLNKTCGIGPTMVFAKVVSEKDPEFGNDMIKRAAMAVRGSGTIRAILWYQGERDTLTLEEAKSYKSKLKKLFQDLRDDLNSSLLPIIQVALASGQGPFIEGVREGQLGINPADVITVDCLGLPLEPDGLHLGTLAQVQLGYKLADAFVKARYTFKATQ